MFISMADKRIYSIVISAVMSIRSDIIYGPRLMNCWLPAEIWVEAVQKIGHIDASLVDFKVRQFNAAFARSSSFGSVMSRFDGSNPSGMFRVSFQHRHYYYLTQEAKQVVYPNPLNRAWKERVLEHAASVLVIPSTRARPAALTILGEDEMTGCIDDIATSAERPSPHKRPRIEEEEEEPQVPKTTFSYWPDSPEARQVFHPITRRRRATAAVDDNNDMNLCYETAKETVQRRIRLLQLVHASEDGWRNVIIGRDEKNFCTKLEIVEIRQRSTFLCCAYQLALANMNDITWHDCCKRACKFLNSLGFAQATFFKTVANWNKVFRRRESFPHPNPYVQCGKRPLPPLLEIFPDAKDQIVSFGIKNLATLTIESVHDFVVSTVVPRLARMWQSEQMASESCSDGIEQPVNNNDGESFDSFLNAHRLESLSLTTIWRWMRLLGFQYDIRKKSFYVDGHERDEVVANRSAFCKRYLTDYEPYCNRWVRLSVDEAKTIKDLNINFGYSYLDIVSNEERIEFHVDYWNRIVADDTTNQQSSHQQMKPATSIRVSPQTRPLMIVGQDESVFAQYLLGSKTWVGPKGQRPLLPKSEGDGYMLSAFVSREFGFGREMTEAELAKVNDTRRGPHRTYIDTQAATEILKCNEKPLLTESPFVKYLYIGAHNEGYWNSYHMSLQFEDVVDCLQVLYPSFDFVFLYDHSQGHSRKRNGALSALQMSRSYGGAQPIMRDTTILEEKGYLGKHSPKLKVGDTQSMVFKPHDTGPWHLSDEQREAQRHDRLTGQSRRIERSKKLLTKALSEAGVELPEKRGYTRKELQTFALRHGIDLFEDKERIIGGWQGQPKGLLQVLWERGLITEASMEKYTVDGRKDAITGSINLQFSLRHLLAECTDFKEEETALQYLGTQLGVQVELTPKFHAELAGEGVEYSWAHAKSYYRRVPVSRKRGRENFKELVRECTCPVKVLNKVRIQKFAARARAYICTYHHLDQTTRIEEHDSDAASPDTSATPTHHPKPELLFTEIERLMKAFKGHRCALDFDSGFVNSQLKEATKTNNDLL